MTPNEERQYLTDLVLEASRWHRSEDDPDSIRLEIQDRLSRLNAITDEEEEPAAEDEEPEPEPEPEPVHARPTWRPATTKPATTKPASFKERKRQAATRYRELNVRVQMDGKPVWKRRDECIQVPIGNGRFRWEWRPDQAQTPAVDKLGDELWAQHEAAQG